MQWLSSFNPMGGPHLSPCQWITSTTTRLSGGIMQNQPWNDPFSLFMDFVIQLFQNKVRYLTNPAEKGR